MRTSFCMSAVAGIALLAVVTMAPPAAAVGTQYVIVGAEPASDQFLPGAVLSPGATLLVPDGTAVTLLGEDGSVNTIPGPAEITITEEAVTTGNRSVSDPEQDRSTISKIAGLLAGERQRAESLGVSRSLDLGSGLAGLDDPWAVSIHDQGPACARNGEVVLGRKDSSVSVTLIYKVGEEAASEKLVWRNGESKFQIDRAFSPTEKELLIEAGKEFAKVELNFLPDSINLKNPIGVVGWMIDSGCERQALAFVKALARTAQ